MKILNSSWRSDANYIYLEIEYDNGVLDTKRFPLNLQFINWLQTVSEKISSDIDNKMQDVNKITQERNQILTIVNNFNNNQ